MRTARVLAALLLTAAALTACAGRPSVADLPEPAPVVQGEATFEEAPHEARPGPVTAAGTDLVQPDAPRTPVEVFRAFEVECAQYAALAGRGDPDQPTVEPDRFARATLLEELDADTAIVVDGRGTALLVDTWSGTPRLLPAEGTGELPDPYRLGCPADPSVDLLPPQPVPAPDGGG